MGTRRRPSRIDPQGHLAIPDLALPRSLPAFCIPRASPPPRRPILEILRRGAGRGDYQLGAYVVMPDRVLTCFCCLHFPQPIAESATGPHRSPGQPGFWAAPVGRSGSPNPATAGCGTSGAPAHRRRHREPAGPGGAGAPGRGLPVVQRLGPREAPATTSSFDTPSPRPYTEASGVFLEAGTVLASGSSIPRRKSKCQNELFSRIIVAGQDTRLSSTHENQGRPGRDRASPEPRAAGS